MRIAQLAGWYSPTSGGIRTVVDRLNAGYHDHGHHPTLVVPAARDSRERSRITLGAPLIPHSGGYRWLVQRSKLGRALSDIRPDVIEVHDKFWLPPIAEWAAAHGVRVVAYSHERLDVTLPLLLPGPRLITDRLARRYRMAMQQFADVIATCSAFAASEFPKSIRVPLGVDTATFRPQVPPPRHEPRRADLELLLVSRLSREKRPDVAIDALQELTRRGLDARLTVLGSGPLARSLERLAAGLPVRFVGFVAGREAVAAAMAAADVALAPGPAETFGLSALEALACGVPVVAAEGAAVSELVAGAAGRGAALSGAGFADAVESVVDVPLSQRRRAARAVAAGHSWDATVDAALAVLTGAVAPSRPDVTVPEWQVTGTVSTSVRTAAPS